MLENDLFVHVLATCFLRKNISSHCWLVCDSYVAISSWQFVCLLFTGYFILLLNLNLAIYCRATYSWGYKILRILWIFTESRKYLSSKLCLVLLHTTCSSLKIYSWNILFKINFWQSLKFYILENMLLYGICTLAYHAIHEHALSS